MPEKVGGLEGQCLSDWRSEGLLQMEVEDDQTESFRCRCGPTLETTSMQEACQTASTISRSKL